MVRLQLLLLLKKLMVKKLMPLSLREQLPWLRLLRSDNEHVHLLPIVYKALVLVYLSSTSFVH